MNIERLSCPVLALCFAIQASTDTYADARTIEQWYLSTIKIDQALAIAQSTHEVVVAIIDTGVDLRHEDLKDQIWINKNEIPNNKIDDDKNGFVDDINGWDFQDNDNKPDDVDSTQTGHGTIAAGVIAATSNNGCGIRGISKARIMPLRAFDKDGIASDELIAAAINYATHNGAHIINASWGGIKKIDTESKSYAALQYALEKSVLVVNAAGNQAKSIDDNNWYPSNLALANLLIVGAVDRNDQRWIGSNYGENKVHIAAPGVDIFTTVMNNTYRSVTGTSIAAPVVSGVAALLKSIAPHLSPKELIVLMQKSGDSATVKTQCHCRINAYEAVKALLP